MTPQEIINTLNAPTASFEIFYTLEKYIEKCEYEKFLSYIIHEFQCNDEIAQQTLKLFKEQIYDELQRTREEHPLTPQQIAHNQAIARESLNKPKCPTCSSTNLKKISTTSKVVNTAMFGLLGTKRHKTFHCNNCGYEW